MTWLTEEAHQCLRDWQWILKAIARKDDPGPTVEAWALAIKQLDDDKRKRLTWRNGPQRGEA